MSHHPVDDRERLSPGARLCQSCRTAIVQQAMLQVACTWVAVQRSIPSRPDLVYRLATVQWTSCDPNVYLSETGIVLHFAAVVDRPQSSCQCSSHEMDIACSASLAAAASRLQAHSKCKKQMPAVTRLRVVHMAQTQVTLPKHSNHSNHSLCCGNSTTGLQ
jgi:hypothetical protein